MPYKDPEKRAECKKRSYERTKQAHFDRQYKRRDDVREYVQDIKSSTPCADCEKFFHFSAMDFDHVTGVKKGNIGTMIAQKRSWKMIFEEIEKCELVCANCHRFRTWKRSMESSA